MAAELNGIIQLAISHTAAETTGIPSAPLEVLAEFADDAYKGEKKKDG